MRFKTFEKFLNEDMMDPPDQESDFTDLQEDTLHCMETNFFPEIGHKYPPEYWEKFWEGVTEELEIWLKFNNSLADLSEELWNKTYVLKGFDIQSESAIYSPKYKEIEKRVSSQYPNTPVPPTLKADSDDKEIIKARRAIFHKNMSNERAFKKAFEKELYLNIFKTHTEEFWKIYKTAIDSLHAIRGQRAGKKFGF